MNDIARNANAFASTFLFFATHNATAEKIKKSLQATAQRQCNIYTTDLLTRRKAADNSTYKKLAVQWLIEALCFVSSFVVADSLVLRNRQLLVAAKRQAVKKLHFSISN